MRNRFPGDKMEGIDKTTYLENTQDFIYACRRYKAQSGILVSLESNQGTRHHEVGVICEQTRRGDHSEQKVEKQNKLGWMCQRACHCSIDIGQQTSNNSDQRIHVTQWIPGPWGRKDIWYDPQSHRYRQKHEDHLTRFQRRISTWNWIWTSECCSLHTQQS